jgi:hypothetical protein
VADNRMIFTLVGRDHLSRVFRQAGVSAGRLKKDLTLLGAAGAIPVAATAVTSAVALAGALGSAGVAVGAFGLAVGGQVSKLAEVSEAQKEYEKAVASSGTSSEEALKAHRAYAAALASLPPETREAAAAFLGLKDAYQKWSDAHARDTMPVLTKSFAVFGALLPKLSPMVRVTGEQLDRLMTIVAGAVASPGMDRMMAQWTTFTESVLRGAVNGVLRLSRTMQDFDPNAGGLGSFIDFAREHGPLVVETLKNLALAAGNVLTAGGDLGVTALGIANAFAKMVNALPPEFLSVLLQMYAAFRLLSLGAAGVAALAVATRTLGRHLLTMSIAASGASGALASLRAAFLALNTAARISVVIAAVAATVVVLHKLSNIGKEAPPNVDRLTTSLGNLGRTGKVTGEAARAFGSDLGGLADSLRTLARPDLDVQIRKTILGLAGIDPKPLSDAKKEVDALDKALANLVKAGKADLAEAAFNKAAAAMRKNGLSAKELRKELGDYKAALADAKLEQELAAQSMGLFGRQAQQTAAKLSEQKASADGLRQAIQALNDIQRAGLGGMIAFEQAIDDATAAAKENAGALDMSGGKLNLNSEKSRAAATALNDLAQKTDEAAASARENGSSWSHVNGIYERGRKKLVEAAMQMGLTRAEAKALADQILKTPDKTAKLKGDMEDLQKKVDKAKREIKSVPPSKLSSMKGTIADLEKKVRDAKARIKSVPPSKRSELRATIADLERKVRSAKAALASVKSRSVTIDVITRGRIPGPLQGKATGGLIGYAGGGSVRGFPSGGLIQGAGTEISDSIPILASRNEYVIKAAAVRKYGVKMFDDLNAMQIQTATSARAASRAAVAGGQVVSAGSAPAPVFEVHVHVNDPALQDLIDVRITPRIRDSEQRQAYRQKVGRR